MVLTDRATLQAARAIVVPDTEHWTMSGTDLASLGYVRADAPEHAELLVVPDRVPTSLQSAVLDVWSRLPELRRFLPLDADLDGTPARVLLGDGGEGGASPGASANREEHGGGRSHDHHDMEEHTGAEGHDHHEMMAIVGDPSRDGLVMETIDFELGPLSSSLPGGLIAELSLDGDVVYDCRLRPTLTAPAAAGEAASAGPGAAAALGAAVAAARERAGGAAAAESTERRRVAAIELERALAQAGWFRSFGTLLGWTELAERAQAAVAALLAPRGVTARMAASGTPPKGAPADWAEALPGATKAADGVVRLVEGSRRLRARAGGRAQVPASKLADEEIGGPVARAAGLVRDARIGDPLYEELGFEPDVEEAGDAAARARVRAREIRSAVAIAAAAASETGAAGPRHTTRTNGAVTVECARGPLRVAIDTPHGSAVVTAPGAAAALALAGESVRGLEFAAAMTGIASFDLSPWKVDQ